MTTQNSNKTGAGNMPRQSGVIDGLNSFVRGENGKPGKCKIVTGICHINETEDGFLAMTTDGRIVLKPTYELAQKHCADYFKHKVGKNEVSVGTIHTTFLPRTSRAELVQFPSADACS